MHIVVGSTSARKVEAARRTFARYFAETVTAAGIDVPSGVPPTPYGRDTRRGARNRARAARRYGPADFHVGLESSLAWRGGQLFEEAWACVLTPEGRPFVAYSSGLPVPEWVLARMRESGREHCEVMEALEAELRLPPNDTWSNYSGGRIGRDVSLEEALRNALIQVLSQGHPSPPPAQR